MAVQQRVGNEGTAGGDDVALALTDRRFHGLAREESADADHGDRDLALELACVAQVEAFPGCPDQVEHQREDRPEQPEEPAPDEPEVAHAPLDHVAQAAAEGPAHHREAGFVVAHGHLDRVGSNAFQDCGDLRELGCLQAGPQRQVVGAVHLDDDRELGADARLDRAQHLAQEPGATLDRAAVHVGAPVGIRREELAHEVAVRGVDLNAVEAGLLAALGRFRVTPDEALDLRQRERARTRPRHELRLPGGGDRLGQPGEARHHLPPAVVELREHLRAVRMHSVGEPLETWDLVVVIRADLPRRRLAVEVDVDVARYDERRAALRHRQIEVDQLRRDEAVVGSAGLGGCSLDQTARDGELADLDRREEQRIVGRHGWLSAKTRGRRAPRAPSQVLRLPSWRCMERASSGRGSPPTSCARTCRRGPAHSRPPGEG